MPRKFLKRFSPNPDEFSRRTDNSWLKKLAGDSHLFHLNRHAVANAVFIGCLCALIPLPGQMIIAIWLAYMARANLPITIACVCITNPFTFAPIFYGAYKFGAFLLGVSAKATQFEISFQWLSGEFLEIWKPLLLGSSLTGLFLACLGYVLVQFTWRQSVRKQWQIRQGIRKKRTLLRKKPEIFDKSADAEMMKRRKEDILPVKSDQNISDAEHGKVNINHS